MQQQHGSGVLRALVDIGHAPTVDREDALRPGNIGVSQSGFSGIEISLWPPHS